MIGSAPIRTTLKFEYGALVYTPPDGLLLPYTGGITPSVCLSSESVRQSFHRTIQLRLKITDSGHTTPNQEASPLSGVASEEPLVLTTAG